MVPRWGENSHHQGLVEHPGDQNDDDSKQQRKVEEKQHCPAFDQCAAFASAINSVGTSGKSAHICRRCPQCRDHTDRDTDLTCSCRACDRINHAVDNMGLIFRNVLIYLIADKVEDFGGVTGQKNRDHRIAQQHCRGDRQNGKERQQGRQIEQAIWKTSLTVRLRAYFQP